MVERTPVYVISVAARLLDVHPQTLRNYERAGFLRPTRTEGRRRLYSAEDIERLRHLIRTVEQYGLNLSGLKLLLELRGRLTDLRRALDEELSPAQIEELKTNVDEMLDLLASTTPVEVPQDDADADPTDATP